VSGRPRIAIVGGDAGAAVTLLEVRPRLGGAAYSFEREGLAVDNGQHVFLRCCTEYRSLLARLGAERDVVLQPRLEIPVLRPDGRSATLRRNGAPAPLHLAGALARYSLLTPRQRLRVARAMVALRRVDPDDPNNDAQTFGGWLHRQRQGEAELQAIWRLIVLPTLNLEPAQASLAQVAQVFQVGLLHDAGAGDIGYARVPLSQLHDGPARRTLAQAGVDVRLRWRAERIVARTGGGCRIEGGDGPVDADAVVVAVPHGRAAALLPPEAAVDADRLQRLGSSPIVNVHVVYDRQVLDTPFAAGVGTPVPWLFDRGSPAIVPGGQYVAVSVSAADDEQSMEPDTLREHYLRALAALLPAARGARVERCFVTREHAATFRAAPGARALRAGPRTGLPSVVLAGSWTDTGWPATMEGAVRSGQTAAGTALATVPRGSQRAAVTA
jgi:squalene-associated FAD-dependent desaturase